MLNAMTTFYTIERTSLVHNIYNRAWRWQYRMRKNIARRFTRMFHRLTSQNHEI